MKEKKECAICGKLVSDFLGHLSISHNIKNKEEFEQKIKAIENDKHKQKEFSAYVDKLKSMLATGDISYEEYRELITKWSKENKW